MAPSGNSSSIAARRQLAPAHLQLTLRPYSKLVKTNPDRYESDSFKSGDRNWKLVVYLTGDKRRKVKDHVSVYLAIDSTNNLQGFWEVTVNFKFFVLDKNSGLYATYPDGNGEVQTFSKQKPEWGLEKMISIQGLEAEANGFLQNDEVTFGVEAFVIQPNGKFEVLSLDERPASAIKRWPIDLSKETGNVISPGELVVGDRRWTIEFYPNGEDEQDNTNVAFYLKLADAYDIPSNRPVYAKFRLRIVNQFKRGHLEKEAESWFSKTNQRSGFQAFTAQTDFFNKPGYVVGQNFQLEAEILAVSTVNYVDV